MSVPPGSEIQHAPKQAGTHRGCALRRYFSSHGCCVTLHFHRVSTSVSRPQIFVINVNITYPENDFIPPLPGLPPRRSKLCAKLADLTCTSGVTKIGFGPLSAKDSNKATFLPEEIEL